MTTPALQQLRAAHPSARIMMLTPAKLADLWTDVSWLDGVISFGPRDHIWTTVRRLKAEAFQCALVFPNSIRSALEPWLAGIPMRIGFAAPGRNLFLTNHPPRPRGHGSTQKRSLAQIKMLTRHSAHPTHSLSSSTHQIHDYLHLAAILGASKEPIAPQLAVAPDRVREIIQHFGLPNPKDHLVLGLNPGAEYGPAKRWPKEYYVKTAVEIHKLTGACWLVFGGQNDRDLASSITDDLNTQLASNGAGQKPHTVAVNLAGRTSLRELCAAIKACRVFLTNDTGPMHLAAALNIPVVALFGSTSPELTSPGLPGDTRHHLLQSQVPCSPCFHRQCPIDFRCMHNIGVDQVVSAILNSIRNPTLESLNCKP